MTWFRPAVVGCLVALASSSGCAYYNTMYSANRLFAEAEKSAARGDLGAARSAWQQSIEKATLNLERHPNSRWRDDARLLMARAHFQLGEVNAAENRLREVLADRPDPERRAAAEFYLGLLAAELGDDSTALTRLNTALADPRIDPSMRTTGLLTRARLRYHAGQLDSARADAQVAKRSGELARWQAAFLELRIAMAAHDSVAAKQLWAGLLREPAADRWTDSLHALARASAAAFSADFSQRVLAFAQTAPWRTAIRDSLLLVRAELIRQSGDTAAAIRYLEQLATQTSGAMADDMRVRAARWKLERAALVDALPQVRSDLLPAIGDPRARTLVHNVRMVEVLTRHAEITAQPLALFAAAELARDELGAPALATSLFLTYARKAPQSPWTPKALLAAGALRPDSAPALHARLESYADNPYVKMIQGRTDDDAFQAAEEGLSKVLSGLLSEATLVASRQESSVNRAAAVLDSIKLAARNDSTRLACGMLVDSLSVRGIRADSIRAACVRGDRSRVTVLLAADTIMLRDSARVRADSLAKVRRIRVDTLR